MHSAGTPDLSGSERVGLVPCRINPALLLLFAERAPDAGVSCDGPG
jgi:hypothetical protein